MRVCFVTSNSLSSLSRDTRVIAYLVTLGDWVDMEMKVKDIDGESFLAIALAIS